MVLDYKFIPGIVNVMWFLKLMSIFDQITLSGFNALIAINGGYCRHLSTSQPYKMIGCVI